MLKKACIQTIKSELISLTIFIVDLNLRTISYSVSTSHNHIYYYLWICFMTFSHLQLSTVYWVISELLYCHLRLLKSFNHYLYIFYYRPLLFYIYTSVSENIIHLLLFIPHYHWYLYWFLSSLPSLLNFLITSKPLRVYLRFRHHK